MVLPNRKISTYAGKNIQKRKIIRLLFKLRKMEGLYQTTASISRAAKGKAQGRKKQGGIPPRARKEIFTY